MINKNKKIEVNGKQYIVEFPNVGKMIDIESMKLALTNNRYSEMAKSGVKNMYIALDIVDTVSFFKICLPELLKKTVGEDLINVSLEDVKHLILTYNKQIKPWFDDNMNQLYSEAENNE